MMIIRKIYKSIKMLPIKQKVLLVAALMVTIALLISNPVLAWFNNQRKIAKIIKIEAPNVLYLNSAHREDAINFEVKGINADEIIKDDYGNAVLYNESGEVDMDDGEEKKITHKDYVFNVTGEAVDTFTIQLAYTTNNPFSYEVWAAKEYTADEMVSLKAEHSEARFVEYKLSQVTLNPELPQIVSTGNHLNVSPPTVLYYAIDTACTDTKATSGKYTGSYLNRAFDASNNEVADTDSYRSKTYPNYSNVQVNAYPIYWQATGVDAFPDAEKKTFNRHFILRVKWNEGALDNSAKETDIIYITVKSED